jgi:phosphoglycolate phosphatase-like HAD superfamily hydrolase
MTTRTSTLVLFDIDGTLVRTLEAGIRSMNLAFGDLHARADALASVAVAGRPDRGILLDAFRAIEVEPTEARIHAVRDRYFAHLGEQLAQTSGAAFGVLPGVAAMLDALEGRPDVTVGLLTGNFEGGAAIKLKYFDLWHRFRLGAFGDLHVDRRDLVPVALARARDLGVDVPASRTVIIGDTPLDVGCAHAHGAAALAVATGTYTRDELVRAGADVVVETLAACDGACGWLDEVIDAARRSAEARVG